MIIGAMIGLSLGMLFVTNVAAYSERIFSLMANRTQRLRWSAGFGPAHLPGYSGPPGWWRRLSGQDGKWGSRASGLCWWYFLWRH